MTAWPSPSAPSATSFPMLPAKSPRFHQAFCGEGRWPWPPRVAMSRLRVKVPKRNIVPLSWMKSRVSGRASALRATWHRGPDAPARLRSAEVLALNRDDALLSEAQLRVPGKGNKFRFLPLAPETVQLLNHYLRLERPNPCSAALFVSLKGRARGTRMTAAGLRSLFRYHRQTTTSTSPTPSLSTHLCLRHDPRRMSLPALMQLMVTRTSRPRCSMCWSPTRRLP